MTGLCFRSAFCWIRKTRGNSQLADITKQMTSIFFHQLFVYSGSYDYVLLLLGSRSKKLI